MTSPDLIPLFLSHTERRFTVINIRDQWLTEHLTESRHPKTLERWIRSQCEAFAGEGLLTRHQPSPRKTYYCITSQLLTQRPSEQNSAPPLESGPSLELAPGEGQDIRVHLSGELNAYRRTLLSQMGELEEYHRLKRAYPSLCDLVSGRVSQLLEDKYKLLGRTQALENVMTAYDSAA